MINEALLIIDVQKGFINIHTEGIPRRIEELVNKINFKHIIATKFFNKDNSNFEILLDWHRMKDDEETSLAINLNKDFKIINKDTYTVCTEEFTEYIKVNNIRRIYIAGLDTDSCILHTAMNLFEQNIEPVILVDMCMSSRGIEFHEYAIKILERSIGKSQIVKNTFKHFKI